MRARRPTLEALLDDCRKRQMDVVVDRFERNLMPGLDHHSNIETFPYTR